MIWLIFAALLICVEVLTQMMATLCLAIGCLAASVTLWAGGDLLWQIVVLATVSLLAYIALMPLFVRRHDKCITHADRTGMDALLGRRAIVTHQIKPGEQGRARIDGDNWLVVAPGCDSLIKAGDEVVVTGYDSIILTVEIPK
ncbi:MAG: NfeD family protein [Bacteroidales bacterium]|nr:NfeD family protein [Bacteroidales bacterium]